VFRPQVILSAAGMEFGIGVDEQRCMGCSSVSCNSMSAPRMPCSSMFSLQIDHAEASLPHCGSTLFLIVRNGEFSADWRPLIE